MAEARDVAEAAAAASGRWDRVSCSDTHCLALRDGVAFSWPISRAGNRFGQLCRGSAEKAISNLGEAQPGVITGVPRIIDVAAGGQKDAGHSALVDVDGRVWTCGCDRWQQLGLSGAGGLGSAAGYTWSRIWQPLPQLVTALVGKRVTRVALGADHSLALNANGREVYSWGRGEAGQLGDAKPFVRAPWLARELCLPAVAKSVQSLARVPAESLTLTAINALNDCSSVELCGPRGEQAHVFAGRCANKVREQMVAAATRAAAAS
ncbi:regulator of chromosome condensation 1/beta-lactamase-inhibitor protein II [Pavlovales sp. CCMP2436]|nr:regulator of chromosome condensation 1/beta-lactamase-inhibitor protein II [Pavlovales sp. CCMP2436]